MTAGSSDTGVATLAMHACDAPDPAIGARGAPALEHQLRVREHVASLCHCGAMPASLASRFRLTISLATKDGRSSGDVVMVARHGSLSFRLLTK